MTIRSTSSSDSSVAVTKHRSSRVPARLAVGILLSFGMSCGGSSNSAEKAEVPDIDTEAPAGDAPEPTPRAETLNACAVLTDAEVERYLVLTEPGASGSGAVGDTSCEWRNPETESTVTLSIGSAGTDADGKLGEPSDYGATEAVPGLGTDARYASGYDLLEFIVDDRVVELQVTIREGARDAAVSLARLVQERI